MPGFTTGLNDKVSCAAKAKPRAKKDAKARAEAFYDDLHILAETEEAPRPRTAAEIERMLVPSSYKQYLYTARLWRG
jgi:hypothetical protein